MNSPRYQLISTDPPRIFTLEEAADLTGMHPEMILEFVQASLIHVYRGKRNAEGEAPRFDDSALVRIRHIENLRHEHINLRTVRYIVLLLDRLDASDRELRALRERLR